MIWVTWRQFRAQALTVLVLLAAAAIGFLVTGLRMHHSYAADLAACASLHACDGATPAARALGAQLSLLQRSYEPMFELLQLLVIAVPALIGIFWGAPLIGRELETGTHQLAWNQTVTRTRWLAVKLTVVGVAAIATAAIFSWLLTWWAGPLDHLNGNRWAAMTFASRDIVPLGYAAFAFTLGTTLGLLLRRTLPAMAITLAVFIAIQMLVPTLIRPHLLPSTTTTFPINQASTSQFHGFSGSQTDFHFDLPTPRGAWLISQPPVKNSSGQVVRIEDYSDCFPGQDGGGQGDDPDLDQIGACLAENNLHETVTYQPASHYWPLQWMEAGIFLVLAGALAGTCFWWIRRRQN
ncbi:transporter [Dactylosporangium fulvum]|uniref:ABC transporter permease n=1 Tax=Dactylosporangium fulvum TaxID=53359 RepID=A0ABY5W144_9ACTN|nr:ABC transporter permease [Dactylosporangium fulvum]UWP83105.1 ABC transporter permease [Dactylosporangium fulvum]